MDRLRPRIVSRDDTILVVIDVQRKLAEVMPRRTEVVSAVAQLVRAAGVLRIPVLMTRQYPEGLGDTVEEVMIAVEDIDPDLIVGIHDKTAFCCSEEEGFDEALDAAGRNQVVLVGMETHICVAQTALALSCGGRDVFVAADACCSRRDLDHEVALSRLTGQGVVVTTSEAVMYEALGRAGTSEFKALLKVVKDG